MCSHERDPYENLFGTVALGLISLDDDQLDCILEVLRTRDASKLHAFGFERAQIEQVQQRLRKWKTDSCKDEK